MSWRGALTIISIIGFVFFALFGAMFYVDYSGISEVPLIRPLTVAVRGSAPTDKGKELAQAALARCKRMGNACPKEQREHLQKLVAPTSKATEAVFASGRSARQLGSVVLAYGASIERCKKRGPAPANLRERLALTVTPAGKVVDVRWDGKARNTPWVRCVTKQAATWLFPAADGEDAPVEVPAEVLLRRMIH